jgi:hypothetical protein
MNLLAILGASGLALVYGSLLEWTVHRRGYHDERVWSAATSAHRLHHEVRYPKERFFERGEGYETSQPWWLEAGYVALHLPLLVVLGAHWLAPTVAFGVTLALYAAAAHYVHPATHLRTGKRYERSRLWKKLVARHVRHHQDQSVNLNVLLPLGDLLFGTLDVTKAKRAATVGV